MDFTIAVLAGQNRWPTSCRLMTKVLDPDRAVLVVDAAGFIGFTSRNGRFGRVNGLSDWTSSTPVMIRG
jgi:hypothetical protein